MHCGTLRPNLENLSTVVITFLNKVHKRAFFPPDAIPKRLWYGIVLALINNIFSPMYSSFMIKCNVFILAESRSFKFPNGPKVKNSIMHITVLHFNHTV